MPNNQCHPQIQASRTHASDLSLSSPLLPWNFLSGHKPGAWFLHGAHIQTHTCTCMHAHMHTHTHHASGGSSKAVLWGWPFLSPPKTVRILTFNASGLFWLMWRPHAVPGQLEVLLNEGWTFLWKLFHFSYFPHRPFTYPPFGRWYVEVRGKSTWNEITFWVQRLGPKSSRASCWKERHGRHAVLFTFSHFKRVHLTCMIQNIIHIFLYTLSRIWICGHLNKVC